MEVPTIYIIRCKGKLLSTSDLKEYFSTVINLSKLTHTSVTKKQLKLTECLLDLGFKVGTIGVNLN